MNVSREKIQYLLKEVAKKVPDSLSVVMASAFVYLSDAHGYEDASEAGKIFEGEVWGLLEGHGHSVFTIALIYGLFSILSVADILQERMTPQEKAVLAFAMGFGLEVAGPLLNSIVDIKDVLFLFPPTILLLGAESLVEKAIKKVQEIE